MAWEAFPTWYPFWTTKHTISAEDSSFISPLYERKGIKSMLHQLAHTSRVPALRACSGFQGADKDQGCCPREQQFFPELTVKLMVTRTAAWGRLKDLHQLPETSSNNRAQFLQDHLELKTFPKLEVFVLQFILRLDGRSWWNGKDLICSAFSLHALG